MVSHEEQTLPTTRPKSRKSLAHIPSAEHELRDKENMTTDLGAIGTQKRLISERPNKKSRSKSIGPGGLDALQDATGNRRSSVVISAPRSILKPTIPPLREIPPHIAARRQSPKIVTPISVSSTAQVNLNRPQPGSSTARGTAEGTETSGRTKPTSENRVEPTSELESQQNSGTKVAKPANNTEQDVAARREARRKSLAARRVSFAPEATLHTWDVVEYFQDSTTSSASTSVSRRASAASSATTPPRSSASAHAGSDASEPPSTPPEQVEEDSQAGSPAHQRDLHQKKRRRSSGIPPLNFNNPDDEEDFSSPSTGSTGSEEGGTFQELLDGEADSDATSDSDGDDGDTAMSLDVDENTGMSMVSARLGSSTSSSARLEEALSLAARQAGTQGIEYDEHGPDDDDEHNEEEEIIASFKPWGKRPDLKDAILTVSQENINPFSPAFKEGLTALPMADDGEGDMTMEMTQAVGQIVPAEESEDDVTMDMTVAIGNIVSKAHDKARGKSVVANRRKSTLRRLSIEDGTSGDETMDLTMAIGGIHAPQLTNKTIEDDENDIDDEEGEDDNEEMTMDFTTVVGGVLSAGKHNPSPGHENLVPQFSGRVSTRREQMHTEVDEDNNTVEMEMTTAVGHIIQARANTAQSKNQQQHSLPPVLATSPARPKTPALSQMPTSHVVATETGSPSLAAFKGKGLRRSGVTRPSLTPKMEQNRSLTTTPVLKPATPVKHITPHRSRPTTPSKTPPCRKPTTPTASPQKHVASKSPTRSTTPSNTASSSPGRSLLEQRPALTPVVPRTHTQKGTASEGPLTSDKSTARSAKIIPSLPRRRSSGIGIDKDGLGAPRLAAILDRRESIGASDSGFSPGQHPLSSTAVRFDVTEAEHDLDRERQEDIGREDARKIMEKEADCGEDEKDVTVNLKEMIESLTPKKRPLKGRKSLHVGAAKGLLGKRPLELEEDDEDVDEGGVKRLKNHQCSPVKNVRLQAPPSKEETTGRLTRSLRRSLEAISGNEATPTTAPSSVKDALITTPRGQGRFRDAESDADGLQVPLFAERAPVKAPEELVGEVANDQIQLQDFLNLTSIRFMELTTTKRRHTVAPTDLSAVDADTKEGLDGSLESRVVAGACTVPMLELFQHSCHELKKYISEGRKVVREIETETLEENPPLFREYISATADVKALMDNQFKNVKTHARLQSKAMWYEWRMQLLNGLEEGLLKTQESMAADDLILRTEQDLLDSVLPAAQAEHERLTIEEADLQHIAEDLADCDQEELARVREELTTIEKDVQSKRQVLADLKAKVQSTDSEIELKSMQKHGCLHDIRVADKIREECRGWTGQEIQALQTKVRALEQQHGWTITGVSGTTTSLAYRSELELVVDPSAFKSNAKHRPSLPHPNDSGSRVDLWYIGNTRERNPGVATVEKEFLLQKVREHCRCLPQADTSMKDLLSAVSTSWTSAVLVSKEIEALERSFITSKSKISDDVLVISAVLLLQPLETKVEVKFEMSCHSSDAGVEIEIAPRASVVYGETFNEKKMGDFLASSIGGPTKDAARPSWTMAMFQLEEKLMARGRK